MKLYSGLLALCALGGASAFTAKAPKAFNTALASTNAAAASSGALNTVTESKSVPADMKSIWDTSSPVIVQGDSLRTWSFANPNIDRVLVLLKSEGRPLHANVELWQGPDNTPTKMEIYNEDGGLRPFSAIIETPRSQNAIAIYNTGQIEFPLTACVEADVADASGNNAAGLSAVTKRLNDMGTPKVMQGGSVFTKPFDPSVQSVQVLLKTDGRPLNARIELLQGPNNNKQVINLYSEDGMEKPFFVVFETPGSGNVVRVVNTATVEFPLTALIEPYGI